MQTMKHYPTISPRLDRHRWFNGFCSDCGCSEAVGVKRSEVCVPVSVADVADVEIIPKAS